MALFETFTFNPSERHPSSFSQHVLQVSPMSTPTSAYEPTPTRRRQSSQIISDLSTKFSEQNITQQSSPSSPSYFDMPTSSPPAPPVRHPSPPRERSWSPPLNGAAYRRLSGAALRTQRQANIKLLTDSSHLRELSALVEKMVDSGSQCRICSSATSSPAASTPNSTPQSPVIDEAVEDLDSMDEDFEDEDYPLRNMKFRRSGDFSAMAAAGATMNGCVKKAVRIRKGNRRR